MASHQPLNSNRAQLRQGLRGYQIFFIVISSVIGTGVFTSNGQALALAGPLGMLFTVIILGLIAIFVGETISELVQVFPVPNAIFEYVYAFVDEDLAWVVGVCYWYSFASVFALQMLGAAALLSYWGPDGFLAPLVFYGVTPFVLFFLNLSGVYWFGIVETIGGFLKIILLFGVTFILYVIAGGQGDPNEPIKNGFNHNIDFINNNTKAICLAFPAVAYSYIGIEATIVAAFEAQPPNGIGWPSRTIHWAVFLLYFLCTLGIALTVQWGNPSLPVPYGGIVLHSNSTGNQAGKTDSAVIIAVLQSDRGVVAGIINGCLIFSTISAANTSLYIASRTLYGLTYRITGRNPLSRKLRKASVIWEVTGTPAMALLWSVLAFYWLPWLEMVTNKSAAILINDVIDMISITSSVSCLIVWAAICVAFHRYERWTRLCDDGLRTRGYTRFIRNSPEYKQRVWNLLIWLQPWNARIGFIGCLVAFAFASAMWWDTPVTPLKVAAAYGTVGPAHLSRNSLDKD
ncbi:amino acid permease-domain-containing protein [Pseudomassariella vexata]|uniref:Amino acid permease-domain-containing protein n=1 Tax=Pseudomassariella vexata TaxID=1141098 RepID=A0A1Y2DLB3_9PEZI|nr:amino acid permease-domain-containing protein [Pseudomassariella vexata]ORY60027.1 amino acid permease-domain-containing protein [Pseudomassariella vexata]